MRPRFPPQPRQTDCSLHARTPGTNYHVLTVQLPPGAFDGSLRRGAHCQAGQLLMTPVWWPMEVSQIISQVLVLCGVALAGIVLARTLRLPFALVCVLVGAGFGQLLPWLALDTGVRASNFADLIFFTLLPPLIFEAGWHLDPARLRRWLPPQSPLDNISSNFPKLLSHE